MTTCIGRRLCGRMDAGSGELEYSIVYPQTGASMNIDRFYSGAAAGYLERIKREYLPALRRIPSDCRGECRIEAGYEESFGGCGLLSVYIDTYEDMGAFRRGFGRTSATWEVRRGRAIGLGDIFFDPGQINRMAAEKIEEEIAAQQARCPGSFYYARRPSKWGWYLCAAGLAVYFQPGSIAPLNAGAPVFLLTWEELAGRMKLGLPG